MEALSRFVEVLDSNEEKHCSKKLLNHIFPWIVYLQLNRSLNQSSVTTEIYLTESELMWHSRLEAPRASSPSCIGCYVNLGTTTPLSYKVA